MRALISRIERLERAATLNADAFTCVIRAIAEPGQPQRELAGYQDLATGTETRRNAGESDDSLLMRAIASSRARVPHLLTIH